MRRADILPLALVLTACGADADPPAPTAVTLDQCFADLRAPQRSFIEVQDYATADGKYRIRRARQPGSRASVGETFPYDLVRFGVETGDHRACITDAARLTYIFGHHNWDDTMEARGGAASYRVHERFEPGQSGSLWTFTLHVLAPDGAVREGPLPLTAPACRTLPYDLNGCPSRTRTDAP